MEGLLFFQVYPSDGFRFILIPDGNPSHEFPVLDGNPSSNMNSASVANNVAQQALYFRIACRGREAEVKTKEPGLRGCRPVGVRYGNLVLDSKLQFSPQFIPECPLYSSIISIETNRNNLKNEDKYRKM
jgi:hypothetical protein